MLIGKVYKIYYLIFLKNRKKKKKTCFFIGLCISKKKSFVKIVNKFDKEQIIINFDENSPILLKIVDIKLYKKLNYRKSKLLFKKNKSYFDDTNNKNNVLDSSLNSFKRKYYFSAYFKITATKRKKKLKKIRRKYFKTLNWLRIKKKYNNMRLCEYEDIDEDENEEYV